MRTPTKPWYRASKDAWYVEFNGKQFRLAKGRDNEKEAREAFYKLMANGSGKLPDADTLRVATICDLFLDYSQKHHVPDTYHWYRGYLQDFCDLYGTLLVQDLKPLHVSRWLDSHPARQPLGKQLTHGGAGRDLDEVCEAAAVVVDEQDLHTSLLEERVSGMVVGRFVDGKLKAAAWTLAWFCWQIHPLPR